MHIIFNQQMHSYYYYYFFFRYYTEYTQNNGAVSIVLTIETAPFFCAYPVYYNPYKPVQYVSIPSWDHHQGQLWEYKLHKLKPTI
jgi:hypothetical protein